MTGGGTHTHICLSYADRAEFGERTNRFLADGLAAGLRVRLVVGGGDGAELRNRLTTVDRGRRSAVEVHALSDSYRGDAIVDPAQQVRAYAAATEDAVAAGFAGLRVAADVTALVRTPAQLDAFARYEYLVDRLMAARPFSAMCAYHAPVLGAATIAQLACLHPQAEPATAAPFRLHATAAGTAISGEVDLAQRELFVQALNRTEIDVANGRMVLDASALTFIGHRGLLALSELARRRSVDLVLRTDLRAVARLVDVLGIDNVRVEATR